MYLDMTIFYYLNYKSVRGCCLLVAFRSAAVVIDQRAAAVAITSVTHVVVCAHHRCVDMAASAWKDIIYRLMNSYKLMVTPRKWGWKWPFWYAVAV